MCDAGLIGKSLEDGKLGLNITERFYKGEIKSPSEVIDILTGCDNANLVGKEVVGIALKEGFIKESDVVKIAGVPHAQIYNLLSE